MQVEYPAKKLHSGILYSNAENKKDKLKILKEAKWKYHFTNIGTKVKITSDFSEIMLNRKRVEWNI